MNDKEVAMDDDKDVAADNAKIGGRLALSARQNYVIAAALSVLSFSVIVAFAVFLVWLGVKALEFTSTAIAPVLVAFFLSMLFRPFYSWIKRYVKNPTLSLLTMFTVILVPLGGLVWFGGSILVDQIANFVKSAPTVVQRTSDWINSGHPDIVALLTRIGLPADQMVFFTDPARFASETIASLGASYGADAVKYGVGAIKYAFSLLSWLLVLVFLCYFIMVEPWSPKEFVGKFPMLKDSTRDFATARIQEFMDIVVGFFRRQVVICLLEGLMYGLGFTLVGLPYGFLIGFVLGVLNLIPFFGTILCIPLALPLAYFGDGGSMTRLVCVLCVWIAGQLADGYLITPKIQGNRTGLNYAEVIFAFLFWGTVFHSFLGLLFAIPLSAFCKVLWSAIWNKYFSGDKGVI